uniref:Uncharacterized protein n=1 Tax=Branchiostoma floridae TaxID=7739 RepID=C3ZDB7_BRAFL|eukprot:XP_002593461.1 hypothetical protein BRAFLDRAFT_70759 [Branchiostoma floridae]
MEIVLTETEILEKALLYQAEHAVASEERRKKHKRADDAVKLLRKNITDSDTHHEELLQALERKEQEMRRKEEEMKMRQEEEMRRMQEYLEGMIRERDAALQNALDQRDAVNMMNESLMGHIDRTTSLLLRGKRT